MSALGKMGLFGNQIFQYAFLRLCARASRAEYQCAPWSGQRLFGLTDPPVTVLLPPLVEGGSESWSIFDAVPEFIPYIEKLTGMTPQRIGPDALVDGAPSGDAGRPTGYQQQHIQFLGSDAERARDDVPATALGFQDPIHLVRSMGCRASSLPPERQREILQGLSVDAANRP